jgi:hypothetical protein
MKQQPLKPTTFPSHSFEPTSDRNIMRFVDRDGNWTHYWIKNQKKFVPAVNHIIRLGYPKGDRFYNYLLRATPDEAEKKLKHAGEEGARTHDAIRDLISGDTIDYERRYYNELTDRYEPLNADEWANLEAFALWVQKYQPQVIIHEYSVWSPSLNYAGTVDFVGTILIPQDDKSFPQEVRGKRILVLLDWKTSGGIWDEYELQVAAYGRAVLETIRIKLPLQEYSELWTGIVRLGTSHKNGYEMRVWNEGTSDNNLELFLSALDIYGKKAGDEFEPNVRQIPAEFALKIPRVRIKRTRTSSKSKTTNKPHSKSPSK